MFQLAPSSNILSPSGSRQLEECSGIVSSVRKLGAEGSDVAQALTSGQLVTLCYAQTSFHTQVLAQSLESTLEQSSVLANSSSGKGLQIVPHSVSQRLIHTAAK